MVRIPIFSTIVYLDNISDPGNMGTIMRTCEWFGVDLLVASENCVDFYNPKVVQASMGSILRLNYIQMELKEFIDTVSPVKYSTYGMVLNGENIYNYDFDVNRIIIIGNESNGISEETLDLINNKITIPTKSADIESLNAAISTSVILSELARRDI
ncbi:MAG: RNA methyltransferase [Saprospiraceae bacterium]